MKQTRPARAKTKGKIMKTEKHPEMINNETAAGYHDRCERDALRAALQTCSDFIRRAHGGEGMSEDERWALLEDAEREAGAALIASAPDLIAERDELRTALRGLLDQVTGPIMVYGDGRGRDGTKIGLSDWEFLALKDKRIAKARAALAAAHVY